MPNKSQSGFELARGDTLPVFSAWLEYRGLYAI